MEYKVDNPLLPASIFLTVFGFSALEVSGHKTINNSINIYCFIVTALHLIFCTVQLIVKVLTTPTSFISVMFLIVDTASTMILTYYRVKMLTAKDVMKNMFSKIDAINERLDSLGVTLSNIKEVLFCCSFMCIITLIWAVQDNIIFGSTYFNNLHPDISTEFRSVNEVVMKFTLSSSVNTLHAYVFFVMFTIKQRLMFFRVAIASLNTSGSRNVAWTVKRRINAADRRRRIKSLRFANNVISNLYFDVKCCYKHYYLFAFFANSFYYDFSLDNKRQYSEIGVFDCDGNRRCRLPRIACVDNGHHYVPPL